MAITTFFPATSPISLDEYIDYIETSVDIHDQDSVINSAKMLENLALNQQLLIDVYNKELMDYCEGKIGASYSPSSAILCRGRFKKFVVRANLWPPLTNVPSREIEAQIFSYYSAHDHNFDFLTANYFGPGYITEIWEYDGPNSFLGFEGEPVRLRFLERTALHSGKQLFYRKSRDIHIQFPPSEFSASINLIAPRQEDLITDQYYFDLSSGVLAGHPSACPVSRRVHLIDIASSIGNEETAELLLNLAKTHPCQRSRAAALSGALSIQPLLSASLDKSISADKSYFVRKVLDDYL